MRYGAGLLIVLLFALVFSLGRLLPAQNSPAVPVQNAAPAAAPALPHPLSDEARADWKALFERDIRKATRELQFDPDDDDLYSFRGDAYFFSGQFALAAADYNKMVELVPAVKNEHWRRGIALFYAGDYKGAAEQFESYHSVDNVDRENGIWRYFSQHKAFGREKAREGLLKYEKDDREPFPAVYKLFAGEIEPAAILAQIEAADVSLREREKRYFYAYLYIGLNAAVEGDRDFALQNLRKAVRNEWGPEAAYGPRYMWHVGRVHYDLLTARPAVEPEKPATATP